jgi:RHS repeat-associated protein
MEVDDLGLINMQGRMFDPVNARFLSPDPMVSAANFSQSWNRYMYVRGNPLSYTDPSGFEPAAGTQDYFDIYGWYDASHDRDPDEASEEFSAIADEVADMVLPCESGDAIRFNNAKAWLQSGHTRGEAMSKGLKDTGVAVDRTQMKWVTSATNDGVDSEGHDIYVITGKWVAVETSGERGHFSGWDSWRSLIPSTYVQFGSSSINLRDLIPVYGPLTAMADDIENGNFGSALLSGSFAVLDLASLGGVSVLRGVAAAGLRVEAREAAHAGLKSALEAEGGANSSRAARREAMREEGIPTSQQPESQSQNDSGRSLEYTVPSPGGGSRVKSVQQQTLDRSHPGQGHWEAGAVKVDPVTGATRFNDYGRPKLVNDKSKVNY